MYCCKKCIVLPLLVIVLGTFADSAVAITNDIRGDYPDPTLGARYDEYPVVVPKRAALLLDRLMVAIKNAMEEEEDEDEIAGNERRGRPNPKPRSLPVNHEDTMGMQRRGQGSIGGQHKGRVYWRCYFNAVTCFKK